MISKAPRGTRDILPGEATRWRKMEELARELCQLSGYGEIRTPIFEHTELFQRGVGEETDIVSKEMYTFKDRGERNLTLRPENTASVVRAYLEHKLSSAPQPVKLYYIGPMFRYDRPQAGRYRQFHQFGVESFGSLHPALDAEIILLASQFYQKLGLMELVLEINSVGCSSCRPEYRDKLKEYFRPSLAEMCSDCNKRFAANPLRILDCKEDACRSYFKDVPTITDNLCPECSDHFTSLMEELKNLDIQFTVNPFLVRGLDYYTKTVFEFISSHLGSQGSLGGGGRYDDLVEVCGGPPTPGCGFAVGLERILLVREAEGIIDEEDNLQVYLATLGDEKAMALAGKVARDLRSRGISCERDYMGRSLKSQFKQANRFMAELTVLLGGQEMEAGAVVLKKMSTGEQKTVLLTELPDAVEKILAGEVFA